MLCACGCVCVCAHACVRVHVCGVCVCGHVHVRVCVCIRLTCCVTRPKYGAISYWLGATSLRGIFFFSKEPSRTGRAPPPGGEFITTN
jgi:hypothetical protein